MGLDLQGKMGRQRLASGGQGPLLQGAGGELIVQDVRARYYEAAREGKVFCAATAVGGVDHGASIGTSPPFVLYNPAASGVVLSVILACMGYISGTLGAGAIVYAVSDNSGLAVPSGTAIVPVNTKTFQATGSVAKPYTTVTVAAAPTLLRPAFNVSAELATTALGAFIVKDHVEGEILIPQGGYLALQGVCGAAGTAPRVMFGMTWEEVPV